MCLWCDDGGGDVMTSFSTSVFNPHNLRTNRMSEAYKRVTSAGFTIDEPEFRDLNSIGANWSDRYGQFFDCRFTCTCGTKEMLRYEFRDAMHRGFLDGNLIDIAAMIERLGAVSRDHLRADGYTEEQIDKIRAAYNDPPRELIEDPEAYYRKRYEEQFGWKSGLEYRDK